MFDPAVFWRRIVWFVASCGGVVGFLVTIFPDLLAYAKDVALYRSQVTVYWFGFFVAFGVSAVAAIFALNRVIFTKNSIIAELMERISNHSTEMEYVKAQFREAEVRRKLDYVTGIPSQEQFSDDLKKLPDHMGFNDRAFLIFLDIIEFGKLNKSFGHTVGDRVIKTFARFINARMRRNEGVYKYPIGGLHAVDDLWKRAYRKYSGGDEFLIIVFGTHADAIGFLNRVDRDLKRDVNPKIQFEILNSTEWSFSFRASVVEIFKQDTERDLLDRAHQALRLANLPDAGMRVIWSDLDELRTDKPNDWPNTAYTEARARFSVDKSKV